MGNGEEENGDGGGGEREREEENRFCVAGVVFPSLEAYVTWFMMDWFCR